MVGWLQDLFIKSAIFFFIAVVWFLAVYLTARWWYAGKDDAMQRGIRKSLSILKTKNKGGIANGRKWHE
jgi:hypothetical protein